MDARRAARALRPAGRQEGRMPAAAPAAPIDQWHPPATIGI